jgi:hypothetical protein
MVGEFFTHGLAIARILLLVCPSMENADDEDFVRATIKRCFDGGGDLMTTVQYRGMGKDHNATRLQDGA